MFSFLRRKKWFEKPKSILLALIVVVVIAGVYLVVAYGSSNGKEKVNEIDRIIEVTTIKVSDLIRKSSIGSTGIVKSAAEVNVVALTNGTIKQLNFVVGDQVLEGQVLAQIYDDAILTNLNNASVNLNNIQLSTQTTKRFAEESVRQAELGYKNAQEVTQTAQISLGNAENNLANIISIQQKEKDDLYSNSIISINGYLNTINTILDQIDYIIKVDGGSQLFGIEPTLAAIDSQSLLAAESSYFIARNYYDDIVDVEINKSNLIPFLNKVIVNLNKTKKAVDDTIWVLESTVPNLNFSMASLLTQKINFSGFRNTLVNSQSQAANNLQNLENIDLLQKQQRDTLEDVVDAAQSQLQLAELSEANAKIAFEQSRLSKDQQVLGAQTALDNSFGQFSLVQNQANDLTIKAPIFGQINGKFVELGDQVTIGKPIASIAQSDLVKIEVDLSSQDIYKVALGQTVTINKNLSGTITNIDPSADPISRKVRLEIAYDNSNKDLIPETFVDVNIPFNEDGNGSSVNLFIPLKAVIITQTDQFVFVADNNFAKKVYIEIGKIEGENIEVISGLDETSQVIVDGAKLLDDGDGIKISDN